MLELKVKSEKSMEPENTSQSSRASQSSQTNCAGRLSKMRETGVQNVQNVTGDWWLVNSKKPLCLCARHGFNGSAQACPNCPKWRKPVLRECKARKVWNQKQKHMFNDSLIYRSGCPEWKECDWWLVNSKKSLWLSVFVVNDCPKWAWVVSKM